MGIMMISSGLLTTIQDGGRRGYQRYGMGVSGAVDVHSYVYANILVGNTHNEAVLEVTMMGPAIEFTSDSVIAVTGGDLSPMLGDLPLPMYQAVRVKKGSVLSFGAIKTGCRAYIAFAGGLAITPIMGSRSTYIKASLGGYEGRALQAGDEIAFRRPASCPPNVEMRKMKPDAFTGPYTVRVLLGPQDDRFTRKGISTFLHSPYTVTSQFDRMGYRLTGPKIEHVKDGNIITDGIAFGSVQVPDDQEPIVMLADRQTTGGYAKIASVINVDMPMIAQSKAGDTIYFVKTDIRTAQDEFVDFLKKCNKMTKDFDKPGEAKVIVPHAQDMVRPVSSQNPAPRPRPTSKGVPGGAVPVPTVVAPAAVKAAEGGTGAQAGTVAVNAGAAGSATQGAASAAASGISVTPVPTAAGAAAFPGNAPAAGKGPAREFRVRVNGEEYDITLRKVRR